MQPMPIANYFKGIRYTNFEAVMRHAEQISQEIRETRQPRKISRNPLTPSQIQVKRLALTNLDGQYRVRKIAAALLKKEKKRITPRKIDERARQLSHMLKRLKNRGEIPNTDVRGRKRQKALRAATNEEIEKHRELVKKVILYGHTYCHRSFWPNYLQREDAEAAGLTGLVRAIETHKPRKGNFKTWAKMWIAQAITRAARREKQKHVATSMDKPIGRDKKITLHDVKGEPALNPEAFDPTQIEEDINILLKKRAKPQDIMTYFLHKGYKHSTSELSRHFGATRTSAHRNFKRAQTIVQRLRQINQEREERETTLQRTGTY
ncbi:MAG: sigma factor [Candidatus Micrarchaeota archaeon]